MYIFKTRRASHVHPEGKYTEWNEGKAADS